MPLDETGTDPIIEAQLQEAGEGVPEAPMTFDGIAAHLRSLRDRGLPETEKAAEVLRRLGDASLADSLDEMRRGHNKDVAGIQEAARQAKLLAGLNLGPDDKIH